jgi:lactate permease
LDLMSEAIWFRAAIAALPIVAVFLLMGAWRWPAHKAALAGLGLAILLAMGVWRYPPGATLSAVLYGLAQGLFPILYIIAASLLLYNLTTVSGWAEQLRASLSESLPNRYYLLLVIGFSFVAFLDSTAGFLTPVTVGTALLVGLGVPALEAAAYTLVSSSLPPIFGAMGIPVVVLSEVANVPLLPLAHLQAIAAGLLFIFFPAWLTLAFGGRAALRALWIPALLAGAAHGLALWATATYLSFYPAGVFGATASMLVLLALSRRYRDPVGAAEQPAEPYSVRPWWPYLLLMGIVSLWSVPLISRWLGQYTLFIPFPALSPEARLKLDWLASPASAILIAALLVIVIGRLTLAQVGQAAQLTARQLRYPLVSMLAMLALAQVMSYSGMTTALGGAVASSGLLFPFVSPYLSWLGSAITGSNTASNAILGHLQATTAARLDLDVLQVTALAGAAAAFGKMVAPQVIAAAMGAGGLMGEEGRLLRNGLFHSLFWVTLVAIAGLALALF